MPARLQSYSVDSSCRILQTTFAHLYPTNGDQTSANASLKIRSLVKKTVSRQKLVRVMWSSSGDGDGFDPGSNTLKLQGMKATPGGGQVGKRCSCRGVFSGVGYAERKSRAVANPE